MKPNKSIKTIALWIFLIVIFVAIYNTVTKEASGKRLTLSDFIEEAIPRDNSAAARMGEVNVYGELVEYSLKRRGASDVESDGQWYQTRGNLSTPIGPDGATVLTSLYRRNVGVTFHKPDEARAGRGSEAPFSQFLSEVAALSPPTNVLKVVIRGKEIAGELKNRDRFTAIGELGEHYRRELIARGVKVTEEPEGENSLWLSILGSWLPMIFIFLIFFLFMRQIQSGGGKAMSFGKSRHKLLNESTHKVTFKDIAGIDEAKEELQEIISFLKDPKKFTRLGGRIPKGVLLMGPPGTGKTLLARGVAGEAGVPFFSISGSDFVEMFVGVGASRVRDLFEQGKKNAPCIIFIDEIDAVGRHRGAGMGGGHDEREQTLNQLLVEMDGFESNEGVILVAATNRPDVLDPALMRPGRFDRRVVVNRPDVKGRFEILRVHTRKTRLAQDVLLKTIARGTPGFSGADLENLVNEAALLAARRDRDSVSMADFENAKDKVMMGAERRSAVLTDDEKKLTAYHEAGHALVAARVVGNDPVHKVTIIPRGMALGVTWTLPERDHTTMTDTQVLARIAMAMGGRVAEAVVFDKITTGAGNDIEQATKLARKMVCEWGMSRLGPIAMANQQGSVFLGREMGRASEFSQSTQSEADTEIRRILNEQLDRATETITERRDELENLAAALIEFESLDHEETTMALDLKSLDEIRSRRDEKELLAQAADDEQERFDKGKPKLVADDNDTDTDAGAPSGLGGEMPEPATRGRLS